VNNFWTIAWYTSVKGIETVPKVTAKTIDRMSATKSMISTIGMGIANG
jgi:hypothetical protein